jgi:hypothetical protein
MQRILLNPRILFSPGGGGGSGGGFGSGGGDLGGGGSGGGAAAPRRVQTLVLQPLQPRVDRLATLYARLWSSGYTVQEERFLSGATARVRVRVGVSGAAATRCKRGASSQARRAP